MRADQRHSGNYQCSVRNQFGVGEANAMVNIIQGDTERRPSMIVRPSHEEVALGGTARFLCNATDLRPSQIIWTFRGRGLPRGASQVKELLTISPVDESHYGEYVCILTNSFGRNEQTVELRRPPGSGGDHDVPAPGPGPRSGHLSPNLVITPTEMSVALGGFARFECRAPDVEPNTIRWSIAVGPLPEGASAVSI